MTYEEAKPKRKALVTKIRASFYASVENQYSHSSSHGLLRLL